MLEGVWQAVVVECLGGEAEVSVDYRRLGLGDDHRQTRPL